MKCGLLGVALLLLPLLSVARSDNQDQGPLLLDDGRQAGGTGSSAEGEQQRLRVCNAYASADALDVYKGEALQLQLTSKGPMPFNTCSDFDTTLQIGDRLEFKAGEASVGTFSVNDLPHRHAVLLLVICRHDALSSRGTFESHLFADQRNAQVAVIDAYSGTAKASPRIRDALRDGESIRSEELRFNSVVGVNEGAYNVLLIGQEGDAEVKKPLVTLKGGNYVVLRTGMEAAEGHSFAQELVVFPNSSTASLERQRSSARRGMGAPKMLGLLAVPVGSTCRCWPLPSMKKRRSW